MRLQDKKVLVVGAGSELAGAVISSFLAEGAYTMLTDINQAALDDVIAANSAHKDRICTKVGDVTKLAEMEAVAAAAVAQMGRIDAMVFCAGIIKHMPIDEMPAEVWNSVINVNLTGGFHACKAVVPQMKAQQYGRIVLVSSIGGRTARPCGSNYAASKAGLIGMSNILSLELAPHNITVNVIAPGPLKGKMFDSMSQEHIDKLSSGIPLKRLGEMSDIAPAAIYLASDEASWMTGEVLDINGGLYV